MVLFPKPASKKSPLWYLPWLAVVVIFFAYVVLQIQEGQKQAANPPTTWERRRVDSIKLPAIKFCANPASKMLFGLRASNKNWCGARRGGEYTLCTSEEDLAEFPGLPDTGVTPAVMFSYGRRCFFETKAGERITQPCYYDLGTRPFLEAVVPREDIASACVVHNELRRVALTDVGSAGHFMRISFGTESVSGAAEPIDPETHTQGTSMVTMHVLGSTDGVYDEGEKYTLPAGSFNLDINPILFRRLGSSEDEVVFRPIFLPSVDSDEPAGLTAGYGPGSHVVSMQLRAMDVDVIEETNPLSPAVIVGVLGGGWGLMQLALSILYKTGSSWSPR